MVLQVKESGSFIADRVMNIFQPDLQTARAFGHKCPGRYNFKRSGRQVLLRIVPKCVVINHLGEAK